jgi:ABC-type polysaccharide/polyol phosphate export permease
MMKYLNPKLLIHYWETIWMLAKTDLKMRYQGSWLGIIWVFLKPFCIFLILNFVFSSIFQSKESNYSIKLLTGLILWSFFAEATIVGMNSILAKAHILKKVFIPKWLVVLSSTIHSSMAFFFNLIILFAFLIFYYHIVPNFFQVCLFFVYILLIYMTALIFSFITAPLFIHFRDLTHIWEVLLQVLFFASPIIYPMESIPFKVQSVLYLNPMTFLIQHSRIVLIDHSFSRLDHHLIFISIVIVCFFGSIWFISRTSRKLIEKM